MKEELWLSHNWKLVLAENYDSSSDLSTVLLWFMGWLTTKASNGYWMGMLMEIHLKREV